MSTHTYRPADRPTFYFIGVTTAQSSIMQVFPRWAAHLELGDCCIRGIDFAVGTAAADYREAVRFIRDDALSLGALITTHKIDLFNAAHDLFDEIDPHASMMGELSCLSKRNGRLICHAKDPISSGYALDGFLPPDHFARERGSLFIMGAGGSAMAMIWHLSRLERGMNRPQEIIVSDPSDSRLAHLELISNRLCPGIVLRRVPVTDPRTNDRILASLPPASLVVNATGLGKDSPGSPLTDPEFPERAIVWELNYRGELDFLAQARAQHSARALQIEDGWHYFIHGWSTVIAEVFDIEIASQGPAFDAMSAVAGGNVHATGVQA